MLVRDTKFGTNVSNKMLLNAAKCQVTSFTVSELLRKTNSGGGWGGGGVKLPPPPRLELKDIFFPLKDTY